MRKLINISLALTFILLFSSCAQGYYNINPTKIAYNASNNFDAIDISYRYDVLSERGNNKIAKKEKKHDIKLLAVKITNNSDKVINIGSNAAFFSGNSMIYPIDAISTKRYLKQSEASHLLYLLLTPLTFSFNGSDALPVGLILGPIITGGNMVVSGTANKNLYKELVEYDILNRDIEAGETVYGIVAFKNIGYTPLTVKFIK